MSATAGDWRVAFGIDGSFSVESGDKVLCQRAPWPGNVTESIANGYLLGAAKAMYEALKLATHELNAIRARDGAPQHIDWYRGQPLQTDSCTHEWWDELTDKCFAAIEQAEGIKP